MLATLDPRAGAEDRAAVQAAAAAAAGRRERSAQLAQLRLAIQRVNDTVRRRHDDAVVAAELLDAIAAYRPEHLPGGAGADAPGARLARIRSALADVVAAGRDLDDGLLDEVEAVREAVETKAAAAAVTDAVADALADLGYRVGPDFTVGTATAGMLQVSHPMRPAHLVRVRVDGAQHLLTAVVFRSDAGAADAAEDAAAESAWCEDLDLALRRLSGDGLSLDPQQLHVGLELPVAEAPPPAATAEERQRRQRHPGQPR
jgi:hypothetical protein